MPAQRRANTRTGASIAAAPVAARLTREMALAIARLRGEAARMHALTAFADAGGTFDAGSSATSSRVGAGSG
jgi:hypothetical protein